MSMLQNTHVAISDYTQGYKITKTQSSSLNIRAFSHIIDHKFENVIEFQDMDSKSSFLIQL